MDVRIRQNPESELVNDLRGYQITDHFEAIAPCNRDGQPEFAAGPRASVAES